MLLLVALSETNKPVVVKVAMLIVAPQRLNLVRANVLTLNYCRRERLDCANIDF